MNELDEIIESVKNLSYDEQVLLGRRCLANIEGALEYLGIDHEGRINFVLSVIGVAVSSDRKASFEEYALFCGVIGQIIKYEDFYDLTNGGSKKEVVDKLDEIVDKLPLGVKRDCCTIVLLFLTVDGDVTEREKEALAQLIAE